MSGTTITSLFPEMGQGILDTFGNEGVVNYAPSYFAVPSSLASEPQSAWTIEQWNQPVTINPNDYVQNDQNASDDLYGDALYFWSEPNTSTNFAIYQNMESLGGGYVYSLTDGSSNDEVDFFMASPAPVNYQNDTLNHPVTLSLSAKITEDSIKYANPAFFNPSYVFATVDLGFTVTFDGAGGIAYGAYSGFIQIDPFVTNSTSPVSYTSGELSPTNNQFTDSKRFASDPGLPLLPSDSDALPDTLTYNVNNYVYYALQAAFAGYSAADQAILLNLANWSIGSFYVGLATNDITVDNSGTESLAASVSANLQVSNLSISTDLNSIYNPSSPVAATPIGDENPQISFYDETVGDGGLADGSTYSGIPGIQDKYIYNGTDEVSLTAPEGQNWEFGGGTAPTTLTAISGNNILVASAGGSTMIGGSGDDTFEIPNITLGGTSAVDTIENFHPGDSIVLSGANSPGMDYSFQLNIGVSGSTTLTVVAENPTVPGLTETVVIPGLSIDDVSGLSVAGSPGGGGSLTLSSSATPSDMLPEFLTIKVDKSSAWSPSNMTITSFTNDGTVVLDPTSVTVDGALQGSGLVEIESLSQLELLGSVAASEEIAFTSNSGTLVIADPLQFDGTINLGSQGNVIDLSTTPFVSGAYATVESTAKLDVVDGNNIISLNVDLGGSFSGETFYLSSDGVNGTDIAEPVVPCFRRDTCITTPTGEVLVQKLMIGDLVLNVAGESKPIRWIGRRKYIKPFPKNPDVMPVLIRADALQERVPIRDLYISPLHALYVDGFLIPAGALVNGVSIQHLTNIEEIEYFHIEMAEHDIILAEKAAAETFIDQNSRQMFDNAEEYWRLYPGTPKLEYAFRAPRLEFGDMVEQVRRKLSLRAGIFPTDQDGSEILGYLEYADRQTVSGWAYNAAQPFVPVIVEMLNRDAILARTVANIPRADVKKAGIGHGRCGFTITLPGPLPALKRHEISVRPVGCTASLQGSGVVIDPGISHDLLRAGGLDVLVEGAARGAASIAEVERLAEALISTGQRLKFQNIGNLKRRSAIVEVNKSRQTPSVLMLNSGWPTVTLDAGSNAIMSHVLAFIELGYRVVFCSTSGSPADAVSYEGMMALEALGVECHGQDDISAERLIRSLAPSTIKLIYLHRMDMAVAYMGLVKQHIPNARIIYAIADVHHLRLERHAAVADRPDLAVKAKMVKSIELFSMRMSDCILTHSVSELEYLSRLMPGLNVHVVTWAITALSRVPAPSASMDVAFIGGADHPPNQDAFDQLAGWIMPHVWRQIPAARCLIVGAGWPGEGSKNFDQRIVRLGHQPDLREVLRNVRLTIAPLRFGSGIHGKVVESFASGTPCVMSQVAAEGLSLEASLQSVVGDGELLVENVLRVFKADRLHRTLSKSGLNFVKDRFSRSEVTTAMARAIGDVSHTQDVSRTKRLCQSRSSNRVRLVT